MLTRWRLAASKLTKRMWFRSTLYGALGIITALAGAFLKFLIPVGLAARIGADSVGNILGILAASMLTVTTFSLSTMVSAYGSASSSATPRAARLLIEDTRAQGALATFIGAFLFSIVGLIALSTGIYGDSGRLVLFGATIAVIIVITVTLLRAIEQFSRFGRVGETIDLVERATKASMKNRADDPRLGGAAAIAAGEGAVRLFGDQVAYVEHVDIERLNTIAEEHALRVHLLCQPGTFATPARPLLAVDGPLLPEMHEALISAIGFSDARSIENDPRFGLVVLAEIAQRAMSPAVNDPGTCIDVIGTCVRLLCAWAGRSAEVATCEVRYPRVHVPCLDVRDMFEDAFTPIARDAAGSLEVNIRLQKALAALARSADPIVAAAAKEHARHALSRALEALAFDKDRDVIRAVASE
ncbi:DUF2254 domain-containing protein [Stenotrophomonas indicatrix]|uniref:DUF2254 domain-containing protein n=1 Tax=Stenotrophomonas indicatrix TaxID=2045451 RepID=UPI0008BF5344|nr:DUF2254 domain-containing protein [Stenotrophomonas indicatrix]SET25480.1 Uncharacterized membrane protein [Stenotrophomonas indicatrix]